MVSSCGRRNRLMQSPAQSWSARCPRYPLPIAKSRARWAPPRPHRHARCNPQQRGRCRERRRAEASLLLSSHRWSSVNALGLDPHALTRCFDAPQIASPISALDSSLRVSELPVDFLSPLPPALSATRSPPCPPSLALATSCASSGRHLQQRRSWSRK